MTTCDFVIVKATGGKGYTNACFKRHADETLAAGKLLGCYHYARDRGVRGLVGGRGGPLHRGVQALRRQGDPIPGLGGGRAGPGAHMGEEVSRPRAREDRREARHLHEQVSFVLLRLDQRGQGLPAMGGTVPELRGDGVQV